MSRISVIGTITAALAVLASMALFAGGAQAGKSSDPCAAADEMVADTTAPDLRKTIRCLIASERAARGLPKLARAESLETAAKRHVNTMIATNCLAHRCPGEVDLERRLRRAGYLDGITEFTFAESTGCGTTAESMVTSWMASPFDRANILGSDFRDLGVAVSQKSSLKLCGEGYGTFAVVFGSREP